MCKPEKVQLLDLRKASATEAEAGLRRGVARGTGPGNGPGHADPSVPVARHLRECPILAGRSSVQRGEVDLSRVPGDAPAAGRSSPVHRVDGVPGDLRRVEGVKRW